MEVQFWNKVCPELKFSSSAKLYYKKFLWKLEISLHGAYYIGKFINKKLTNHDLADIILELERRRSVRGWYYSPSGLTIEQHKSVNAKLINEITSYIDEHKVKKRVEKNTLSVFFLTEDDAKKFVTDIQQILLTNKEKLIIKELAGPADQSDEQNILSGKILSRQADKYNIMVTTNPMTISVETAESLVNLFNSEYKNIRGAPSMQHRVKWAKANKYHQYYQRATTFYCTSELDLMQIHLVAPSWIKKVDTITTFSTNSNSTKGNDIDD